MISTLKDYGPALAEEELSGSDEMGAMAHDEIAQLAYSYWEARGNRGGSPWEDWFRAEQELKQRKEL